MDLHPLHPGTLVRSVYHDGHGSTWYDNMNCWIPIRFTTPFDVLGIVGYVELHRVIVLLDGRCVAVDPGALVVYA